MELLLIDPKDVRANRKGFFKNIEKKMKGVTTEIKFKVKKIPKKDM